MASIRRLARAWNSSSNLGRTNAGASRETGTRLRAPKSPRRAERYPASAPLCQYRDILDPSGPASGVALSINPPHDQRKAKNIPPSGPAPPRASFAQASRPAPRHWDENPSQLNYDHPGASLIACPFPCLPHPSCASAPFVTHCQGNLNRPAVLPGGGGALPATHNT